jgi:DUF218 domain
MGLRRLSRAASIAVFVPCVFLLVFAITAGEILVVDNPQRSDVIVVLAGETNYRPAHALDLLDQGYAHGILLNVPTNSTIYKFTQLQLAQEYIHDLPRKDSIALCPIEGLSTRDEARDVKKCLEHETARSILIVTSDYHTRRSLSIFERQMPDRSFSIAATADSTQFGTRWWKHRQWAKTCLDEWLRLLWWNVVERWR